MIAACLRGQQADTPSAVDALNIMGARVCNCAALPPRHPMQGYDMTFSPNLWICNGSGLHQVVLMLKDDN